MNEINTYRSAKLLIKQYGADAAVRAAIRADAMEERGDMAGYAVWKRTVKAIVEILSTEGRAKH